MADKSHSGTPDRLAGGNLLPEGWESILLGSVVRVSSGVGFPKQYQGKVSGTYPVYKVGDVSKSVTGNKGILDRAGNYVDEAEALSLKGEVFSKGTTLFAKIGEAVKLNRRAFVISPGLADNNVMAVCPDNPIESKFIFYFMNTVDLTDVSRSTTVPSVRKGDIEGLEIKLPPLAEQKVIAEKLDTLLTQVDTTKARLERIPDIIKRFRQSVLAAAVSGKLTEEWRGKNPNESSVNDEEAQRSWEKYYSDIGSNYKRPKLNSNAENNEPFNLPNSWRWTSIGYLFDVYVGATPSRNEPSYWDGAINWVSSSEVAFCRIGPTKEKITTAGFNSCSTKLHPPGTVLLAMIGQGKTRGQVAILDEPAGHNQNTAALRVNSQHCISEYLYHFLCERYEETRRVGSGNNQQALNKKSVQELPFPLPPKSEQTEIVRRVEELFAFADSIEHKAAAALERVNNLSQSILAKAFRGELTADWRAANPELISGDNSAEALLAKIQAEREALALEKKAAKKLRKKKD